VNVIFTHRLEVRFRDCDPIGHVNNAVYLTYLEQTRFNHWRASGIASGPDGDGIPSVILARVEIDYRRQVRYGDRLEIRLGVAAIGRTSFTYEYEIVSEDGQVVATARTVLVSFDYAAGRPTPVTDVLREALTRQIPS
jgi:acyl-CoA thioester hydrolase